MRCSARGDAAVSQSPISAIHPVSTLLAAKRARPLTMLATRSPRFCTRNLAKSSLRAAQPSHAIWVCSAWRGLRSSRGGHIISNKAEHHAVLNAVEHLEDREGFEVTWLNVSKSGMVDLDQLADSIRPDTKLVSIMTANNETGVVQPMREISRICRERGVLLHSDIVQAFGKLDIDVSLVDAGSFAAHKFYGPKGTGFLFLRSGLPIQPLMFGGAHENQRRPGTENVAGVAGMAAAAEWVLRDADAEKTTPSAIA